MEIVLSGCGKVLAASATQALIDRLNPKVIFHLGTGGAISPELMIGDIVLGREIVEHDYCELFPEPTPPPISSSDRTICDLLRNFADEKGRNVQFGTIVSGDQDVLDESTQKQLFERYDALSIDWESSAVARVCELSEIPVVVLRTISDHSDADVSAEYLRNASNVASSLCDLVADFISAPAFREWIRNK